MAASTVLSVEGSFVSFFKNNACTLAKLCLVAFPHNFFLAAGTYIVIYIDLKSL